MNRIVFDENLAWLTRAPRGAFSLVYIDPPFNTGRRQARTRLRTVADRDPDLDTVFAPELPGLDRDEIRHWYNGYGWLGEEEEKVYNPFDILLLFDSRRFGAW